MTQFCCFEDARKGTISMIQRGLLQNNDLALESYFAFSLIPL